MPGYFTYTFTRTDPSTGVSSTIPASSVTGGSLDWHRNDILDPITLRTGTLTGIKPEALPTINIGDVIAVIQNGATPGIQFQVADFRVIYGANAAMDTWELSLECWLTRAGRTNATVSWSAQQTVYAANTVWAKAGLTWDAPTPAATGYQRVSAQSLTNVNILDTLRQIWYTEQTSLSAGEYQYVLQPLFYVYPPKRIAGSGGSTIAASFSDDGTVGTSKYLATNLDFGGIADNYWTGVLVQPTGVTAQRAGTETRCYVFNSYDETAVQAAQTALYALSRLASYDRTPLTLRYTYEQQGATVPTGISVGSLVKIKFRSTDYYAFVNGINWTFGPAQTAVELTLVPYIAGSFLTLDNTVLGRLDYNKLSF